MTVYEDKFALNLPTSGRKDRIDFCPEKIDQQLNLRSDLDGFRRSCFLTAPAELLNKRG